MQRVIMLFTVLLSALIIAQPSAAAAQPTLLQPGPLSAEEAAGLTFMREEEKLARDVYLALDARWQTAIFAQIAASETQHMEAVKLLLDRYGLADPAAGKAAGVFSDPQLQDLYTSLNRRGTTSLSEALAVGGLIEEVDLADLQQHSAATDNADIAQLYANLSCGSRNHLRAFAAWYETTSGAAYTAQHLEPAQVAAIRAMPHERCGQGASTPRGPGGPRRP